MVPFAIKTDYWEIGKVVKDLGHISRNKPIHMAFGEPMTITATGKQENTRIIEFIISHLKEWGGEVA